MAENLRDWVFFKRCVRRQDDALRRYSIRKRGRVSIEPTLFADMVDRRNRKLYCANAAARIAFARAAGRHVRDSLQLSRRTPAYFLTLTPIGHCMPFEDATDYDWSPILNTTAELLAGHSFWGALDAAYFSAHPTSQADGAVVSFHTHTLVWDIDVERIETIVGEINKRVGSLLPGRPAAHIHAINNLEIAVALSRYAVKPPLRNYRGFPLREHDGRLSRNWTSREWDLYPRDAARMARVLMGVEIDSTCFGGGTGIGFTTKIAEDARLRIRSDERREFRRIARALRYG